MYSVVVESIFFYKNAIFDPRWVSSNGCNFFLTHVNKSILSQFIKQLKGFRLSYKWEWREVEAENRTQITINLWQNMIFYDQNRNFFKNKIFFSRQYTELFPMKLSIKAYLLFLKIVIFGMRSPKYTSFWDIRTC